MKTILILLLLTLLVIPIAFAQEEEDTPSLSEIISNLAKQIPKKLFEFVNSMFDQSMQPLLDLTKKLLREPVSIGIFKNIWSFIIYIISMFYGLLLLYSGFNLMTSGYDAEKRTKAKDWLKNILIMVILVQSSFMLYSAVLDLNSALTTAVLDSVDEEFFTVTSDSIINFGLQFFMGMFYTMCLGATVMLLAMRYIFVAVGIAFFPIAIFLYFIEPLQPYGKLILNFLGICILITFFDALILLVCSKFMQTALFQNLKIVLSIATFSIINLLMFYLMLFSAIRSAAGKGLSIGFKAFAIKKLFFK